MMVIDGKRYRTNLENTMQLRTLARVKRETGFGWHQIRTHMRTIGEDEPLADAISDPRMQAWMYAWVLNAEQGSDLTFEEFTSLDLGSVEFTADRDPDASDVGDALEEGPTRAPTDGRRGEAEQPASAAAAAAVKVRPRKPAKKAAAKS